MIALVVVLAVASAAGFALRRRQGRFTRTDLPVSLAPRAPDSGAPGAADGGRRGGTDRGKRGGADRGERRDVLTAADLGASLGERATLVQFSTEFCRYCAPTRELLGEVAASRGGIALIEIDAAERMDLTRRLNVYATPTVLVLGPGGEIAQRSSGRPRKADVLAAVGSVLAAEGMS